MTSIPQLLEAFRKAQKATNGVTLSTDTRKITEGQIYLALKGANFDGNKYVDVAFENGASLAIVDDPELEGKENCLLVKDGLKALQDLSGAYRDTLTCPIIAVTGSNGKTTTKELLLKVLGEHFKTYATQGNLNNHIGVPLTLLGTPPDTEMLILEMGDNHRGEVASYCTYAKPTHGFITNIGKDHLEGFGSMENNIAAKKEIYNAMYDLRGVAFVDGTQRVLLELSRSMSSKIVYGLDGTFAHLEYIDSDPFIQYKDEEGKLHTTKLYGSYNMDNIQTAYAIGKYFDVPMDKIHKGLTDYQPGNNRSQLIQKDDTLIVQDAYNANPSSMEAALKSFAELKTQKRKIVLFGLMNESGEDQATEHYNLISAVENAEIDKGYFFGPEYGTHASLFTNKEKLSFFEDKDALVDEIKKLKGSPVAILAKGSRIAALEKVTEVLL